MQGLYRVLANAPTFAILYILLMIPTYLLPYMGSNSAALSGAGVAAGAGFYPLFWVHLICLMGLCALAFMRGSLINKAWIVIFPILALLFDLVPGMNFIPLVPTILHIITIVVGVSSRAGEHT